MSYRDNPPIRDGKLHPGGGETKFCKGFSNTGVEAKLDANYISIQNIFLNAQNKIKAGVFSESDGTRARFLVRRLVDRNKTLLSQYRRRTGQSRYPSSTFGLNFKIDTD